MMVFEIVLRSSRTPQLSVHVSTNELFVIPIPKSPMNYSKSDDAEDTILLTIADASNGQCVYLGDIIPGKVLSHIA